MGVAPCYPRVSPSHPRGSTLLPQTEESFKKETVIITMGKIYDPEREDKPKKKRDRLVQPARQLDPDECPAGYDPDVWDMTLLFTQCGLRRDTRTVDGPLLYAMLLPRMTWLRDQRAKIDETVRGSWSADGVTRFSTWQEMGRAAIELFWRESKDILEPNDPGPYAAEDFCHPLEFRAIIQDVRRKSVNKHSRGNA
jgi:hypothetical protein